MTLKEQITRLRDEAAERWRNAPPLTSAQSETANAEYQAYLKVLALLSSGSSSGEAMSDPNVGYYEAPKGVRQLQVHLDDGTVVWWRLMPHDKATCFVRQPGKPDFKNDDVEFLAYEDDDDA